MQRYCVTWIFCLGLLLAGGPLHPQGAERELEVFDLGPIVGVSSPVRIDLPGPPTLGGAALPWDRELDRIESVWTGAPGDDEVAPSSWISARGVKTAVRGFIDPDSWSNVRNALELREDRLVVIQRPETLERIRAFLGHLAGWCQRRFRLELAIVPLATVEALDPGWRRAVGSPWRESDFFDRCVAAGGEEAAYHSALLTDGAVVAFAPGFTQLRVLDHEVNQTGVVPVVGPVVNEVPEGAFGRLRVQLSPEGRWARVEARVGCLALARDDAPRRIPGGDLDLLRFSQEHVATTVAAPLGTTVRLAAIEMPRRPLAAADGADALRPRSPVVLARLRAVNRQTQADGDPPVVLLDAGLPVDPPADQTIDTGADDDDEGGGIAFASGFDGEEVRDETRLDPVLEQALRTSGGRGARLWRESDVVFVRAAPGAITAAREALESMARERSVVVSIELWQGVVTGEERDRLGRAGAFLPPEWLEKFSSGGGVRVRLAGLAGVWHSVATVTTRLHLAEVEMVSGGTGFQVTVAGDPVVRHTSEGLGLNVRADLVPGTPWLRLQVAGSLARPPRVASQVEVRTTRDVDVEEGEDGKRTLRATGESVQVDLVEEDRDIWQHLVTAPAGQPVLLNMLPDADAPGRSRVLLGLVRPFLPWAGTDDAESEAGRGH